MKRAALLVFTFGVLLGVANPSRIPAQQAGASRSTVTLYSDIKYRGAYRQGCLSLQTGVSFSIWSARAQKTCDLYYGMLEVGNEKDWVQSASGLGQRSVIKDLGVLDWTSSFEIPVVDPLPKLKPGEQRSITIDASGADGADGAAGAPGEPARPGADADGVVRATSRPEAPSPAPRPVPSRPKHDGKPKIDPLFVKAVAGHLYVIHVVNDVTDFYALFRLESLESGDQCTISWQLIPNPEVQKTVRK